MTGLSDLFDQPLLLSVTLWALAAASAVTVVQRAVHIHPTVSELIPTMLGDLKPLE